MPAWIDAWQESRRVQRQALRQTARKKTLPYWNTSGIFQEAVTPVASHVRNPGSKPAKSAGAQLSKLQLDGATGRTAGKTAGRSWGHRRDDDEEDSEEDEDDDEWEEAEVNDPRGLFAQKLERRTKLRSSNQVVSSTKVNMTKQSLAAQPLRMHSVQSTSEAAMRTASSIREELLGFCKQLGLSPPVVAEPDKLSQGMQPVADVGLLPKPPRKREDLASQLRDHTISRARRQMQSKRSACVQTAAVYDDGLQLDQADVIKTCGLGRLAPSYSKLGKHEAGLADLQDGQDVSPPPAGTTNVLGDDSWGEIVVKGMDQDAHDANDLRMRKWQLSSKTVRASIPQKRSSFGIDDVASEPTQRDGLRDDLGPEGSRTLGRESHSGEITLKAGGRVSLPFGFGSDSRAQMTKLNIDSMARRQIRDRHGGLYDVPVIQALRQKASRNQRCDRDERPHDWQREELEAEDVLVKLGSDASSHASPRVDIFGEDREAAELCGLKARQAEPEQISIGPTPGDVLPECSPATTACLAAAGTEGLGSDEVASTYKDYVQDDILVPSQPQAKPQEVPESPALDMDLCDIAVTPASPSSLSGLEEELPPLPPYRPLPSLSAQGTAMPLPLPGGVSNSQKPQLTAKDLEERFYGSLQVLDSVQEHLSVVDILAAQQALQQEQRHALERRSLLEAQAMQEQQLQQALTWLEKQRADQMAELQRQAESSQQELAHRRVIFDEEMAARERLRQAPCDPEEAEAFEREHLQQEREEVERQKDQEEMVRQWTLLEKERDEANQERRANDLQREAVQRERERLLEEGARLQESKIALQSAMQEAELQRQREEVQQSAAEVKKQQDEQHQVQERLRREAEQAQQAAQLQREADTLKHEKEVANLKERMASLQLELSSATQMGQPASQQLEASYLEQLLQRLGPAESRSADVEREARERAQRDADLQNVREACKREEAQVAELKSEVQKLQQAESSKAAPVMQMPQQLLQTLEQLVERLPLPASAAGGMEGRQQPSQDAVLPSPSATEQVHSDMVQQLQTQLSLQAKELSRLQEEQVRQQSLAEMERKRLQDELENMRSQMADLRHIPTSQLIKAGS